jgi:hypothetical protein
MFIPDFGSRILDLGAQILDLDPGSTTTTKKERKKVCWLTFFAATNVTKL